MRCHCGTDFWWCDIYTVWDSYSSWSLRRFASFMGTSSRRPSVSFWFISGVSSVTFLMTTSSSGTFLLCATCTACASYRHVFEQNRPCVYACMYMCIHIYIHVQTQTQHKLQKKRHGTRTDSCMPSIHINTCMHIYKHSCGCVTSNHIYIHACACTCLVPHPSSILRHTMHNCVGVHKYLYM